MKIAAAKKIQTLPDDYKIPAETFIERFDTLRHKEILTLNASATEIETIKLLSKQNSSATEKLYTIADKAKKATVDNAVKIEIDSHFAKEIAPRLAKLSSYAALLNSPLLAENANPIAKAAYSTLSGNVVDRIAKIQEFCNKPPRGTSEADLKEAKSMLNQLKTYQREVSFFVSNEHFTITESKELPAKGEGNYDGYIRAQPLPAPNENKMGLDIVINANKLETIKSEIVRENVRNRIIAHEMQHAVQWNNGKIAYATTGNFSLLFYDLTDEVDAIQKEYALYGDDPRNSIFGGNVSVSDITVDNQSIAKSYSKISHLPMDLNLDCTVEFIRENNLESFKSFIILIANKQTDDNAIFRYANQQTYAGLELKLKNGSGWEVIGGLSFKKFLELFTANYPEVDTRLHYKK